MAEPRTHLPFALADVDADPVTEVGMILLGLPPQLLLAGLGTSGSAVDTGRVALAVDRLRHAAEDPGTDGLAAAVAAGARRWGAVRSAVESAVPVLPASAAVRTTFTRCHDALDDTGPPLAAAERSYLAACWIRRADVDPCARAAAAPASSEGPR